MPSCSEFQKLLPLYLDGELPGAQGAALVAHLETCPTCAQQAARLRWLASVLAELPVPDPPPDFVARVRVRLAARQVERAAFRARCRTRSLALAAVVGGVLGGLSFFLPPFPRPWEGVPLRLPSMQAGWDLAKTSLAESYHAMPFWWQQTRSETQGLLRAISGMLERAPTRPWWGLLMQGLWVALGVAIVGNVLRRFLNRPMKKNGAAQRMA